MGRCMERCPDHCIDIICLCFYRDGVEVRCSEYIQSFVSSRAERAERAWKKLGQ